MVDKNKKQLLVSLGEIFTASLGTDSASEHDFQDLIERGRQLIESAHIQNSWFTTDSVRQAIFAWSQSLQPGKIDQWLSSYNFENPKGNRVGVIAAGNIPLVGLHDLLCVLINGDQLKIKLSSKDQQLMQWAIECLITIEPELQGAIEVSENLKDINLLIATGSDNSSRYFEYYFKEQKRLLRKNRTSVAVLNGTESAEDLVGLSEDVFTHFGLGCRNVTKVYVPRGYDFDPMFNAFFRFKEVINHNKYANNYDYNKAVYLLNKIELVENGFLLLKEDEGLHSPVGVLFYSYYDQLEDVWDILKENEDQIQCKVGTVAGQDLVPFGKAQLPELVDYADGVDTIEFLQQTS